MFLHRCFSIVVEHIKDIDFDRKFFRHLMNVILPLDALRNALEGKMLSCLPVIAHRLNIDDE